MMSTDTSVDEKMSCKDIFTPMIGTAISAVLAVIHLLTFWKPLSIIENFTILAIATYLIIKGIQKRHTPAMTIYIIGGILSAIFAIVSINT